MRLPAIAPRHRHPRSRLRTTVLFFLVLIPSTTATCYWPSGKAVTDNYLPCPNSKVCCAKGEACLSNGLCYGAGLNIAYRGACTDKSWPSADCPDVCPEALPDQWANLFWCPDSPSETYTCSYSRVPSLACTLNLGQWNWSTGGDVAVAQNGIPSPTSTRTSTVTSTVSITASASSTDSNNTPVSTSDTSTSMAANNTPLPSNNAPSSADHTSVSSHASATAHSSSSASSSSSSKPSSTQIPIALGLGVGLGVPLLIVTAFLIYSCSRKPKTPPQDTKESQATTSSQRGSQGWFSSPRYPTEMPPMSPKGPSELVGRGKLDGRSELVGWWWGKTDGRAELYG